MKTLGEFIIEEEQRCEHLTTGELSRVLSAIELVGKVIHSNINRAGLNDDILGFVGSQNIQGENQMKLDIFAHNTMQKALCGRKVVAGFASEESEDVIIFNPEDSNNAKYVVLADPLDGSSNVDVNVSVGTIFSIYKRISPEGTPVVLEDFLQAGNKQVAAGYIIYGSSTMLVYTTGKGTNGFTYDPSIGEFCLSHRNISIPKTGSIYSVNEGQYIKFPQGVKKFIKYCQEDIPSENRPYTARYIGSLVSDFHRNMLKGGIYLYPQSTHYKNGKLRLLYEANPIALLAEQAGGLAINGNQRILDIVPNELHQRVPLFVGSKQMVEKVHSFLQECGENNS